MALVAQLDKDSIFVCIVEDYNGPLPYGAIRVFPPDTALAEYHKWRWNGEKYTQVEDYRGNMAYHADGTAYKVTAYGSLPDSDSLSPPEPIKTLEDVQAEFEMLIQSRLDSFARSLTYESMLSASTYATSKNPVFALEGQYCVEARDDTWAKAYEILNALLPQIAAGEHAVPEWAEIEAQLPPLAWPEGSRGYKEAEA